MSLKKARVVRFQQIADPPELKPRQEKSNTNYFQYYTDCRTSSQHSHDSGEYVPITMMLEHGSLHLFRKNDKSNVEQNSEHHPEQTMSEDGTRHPLVHSVETSSPHSQSSQQHRELQQQSSEQHRELQQQSSEQHRELQQQSSEQHRELQQQQQQSSSEQHRELQQQQQQSSSEQPRELSSPSDHSAPLPTPAQEEAQAQHASSSPPLPLPAKEDAAQVTQEGGEHTSFCDVEEDSAEVSSGGRGRRASSCGGKQGPGSVSPRGVTSGASARSSSSTTSGNLDAALNTLKSELTALREQDLQLLKQLMHIHDNIRRLKRARWLQRGGRTASCGVLGARSPAPQPPGGLRGVSGREGGGGMLQRQRSEPGLLCVPGRSTSTLTSTSSSFETIEDEEEEEEEADSLYGSSTDLPSDTSPAPSPFSPTKPSTPSTPTIYSYSPSAFPSLTFTQQELWRGECSYGEILKRNIRLWKWSVASERQSGVAGSHFCLL